MGTVQAARRKADLLESCVQKRVQSDLIQGCSNAEMSDFNIDSAEHNAEDCHPARSRYHTSSYRGECRYGQALTFPGG